MLTLKHQVQYRQHLKDINLIEIMLLLIEIAFFSLKSAYKSLNASILF